MTGRRLLTVVVKCPSCGWQRDDAPELSFDTARCRVCQAWVPFEEVRR